MSAITINKKIFEFEQALLEKKSTEEVLKIGHELCKACSDVMIDATRKYCEYVADERKV